MQIESSSLFDGKVAAEARWKMHGESAYHYLKVANKAPIQRIRQVLDAWYIRFPEFHTRQWLGRFRSLSDAQHLGALFEIFNRALLDAHGYSVEHEPLGSHSVTTRPEFAVTHADGEFLLECTTTLGGSYEVRREKLTQGLLQTIDRIKPPGLLFSVTVNRVGSTARFSALHQMLKTNIRALKSEADLALAQLIPWEWNESGWDVEIKPIPIPTENYESSVGMFMSSAEEVNIRNHIFNSLKAKAGKYGKQERSYVIALGYYGEPLGAEEVVSALFGSKRWVIGSFGAQNGSRAGDGFWKESQNTRVSAVIAASNIYAHTIVSREAPVTLYHNPWAALPFPQNLWKGDQVIPNRLTGKLDHLKGKSIREILEFPAEWPFWEY